MDFAMSVLGVSLVIIIGSFLWVLGYILTLKGDIERVSEQYPKHVRIASALFGGSIIAGLSSAFVVIFMIVKTAL